MALKLYIINNIHNQQFDYESIKNQKDLKEYKYTADISNAQWISSDNHDLSKAIDIIDELCRKCITIETTGFIYRIFDNDENICDFYIPINSRQKSIILFHKEGLELSNEKGINALIETINKRQYNTYRHFKQKERRKNMIDQIFNNPNNSFEEEYEDEDEEFDIEDSRNLMKVNRIIEHINAELLVPSLSLKDYVGDQCLMEELIDIKDIFNNRKEYAKYNVTIPRGILLKGPAGTGKSYAAKCLAGETDSYFLSTTASSLQGQYVGSGSRNIKALFDAARKITKETGKGVIIFIDELDSFGKRNNDKHSLEESRTINQLLTELSGINDNGDVLVIGATNLIDEIDKAITRPGRLSKQIYVGYPDKEARKELIHYYLSKSKLSLFDVSVDTIADLTVGISAAGITEVINTASIKAIKCKREQISIDDINESVNAIITKSSKNKDDVKNLSLISSHEAGHVIAEIIYNKHYPIKVSSYSYGSAGGFTQSGKELNGIMSKEDYINEIKVLLAGRAAEEILCNIVTSGASQDISLAKGILNDYYNTCQFERYDVSNLKQIIVDKIEEIYQEVICDLNEQKNLDILNDIKENLLTKRILLKNDIKGIVNKHQSPSFSIA